MRVSPAPDETVLRGPLVDQSALLGVVNRLHYGGNALRGIRARGPGDEALFTTGGETVLQGAAPDQEALVSLIYRVQGWGLDLRGLRQLNSGAILAGGVPCYEIRVAGRIGPGAVTFLRELGITARFETTAAAAADRRGGPGARSPHPDGPPPGR